MAPALMSSRNQNTHGAQIAEPAKALAVEQLYRYCDLTKFTFATTEDLNPIDGLIGQERALNAIDFGSRIKSHGFNLFVLGPPGSGKHRAVRTFLTGKAQQEATPNDWIYVNNFKTPHKPISINLPHGEGIRLRDTLARVMDDLHTTIPAIFESEEYQARRGAIEEAFRESQDKAFSDLRKQAAAKDIAVIRTPMGFGMAPTRNGKVIEPEVFNRLEEHTRKEIEEAIEGFQKELEAILKNIPRWDKERREKTRALNQEMATVAVSHGMAEIERDFNRYPNVASYLQAVRTDLIDNVGLFLLSARSKEAEQMAAAADQRLDEDYFSRYQVNVLVSHVDQNNGTEGAPVIFEDHPTLSNLVGRVEQSSQMGALVTNFSMIKPGVLHQANGGYLILDARKVLIEPFAWEALKRALQSRHIKIESPGQGLSLISTVSLEPDPIPLNIKIVLVGDRQLYYMLCAVDPEFGDLFKVAADFDETIDWTSEANDLFAPLIATICHSEELKHVTRDGVARLIEHAARMADDAEKLSIRVGPIADVIREADFWADETGQESITREHVSKAIEEHIRRHDRTRELSHEAITRDIVLIDTQGEATGQINGLSVLALGNFAFGRPTRITANVRIGTGRLIDIEREVELGGPLHSKGILILSGFLFERYALDVPLSLSASLVFEQSYGGVDGDSASSAELYALLSAIGNIPIKQSYAVTGSVNQKGQVQPIGGVNEKIEGFFDICRSRGLSGDQGVLIPAANEKHLMLREDVVEACKRGEFHVYSVATIDQGMEILTGVRAGSRGADGRFPEGTANRMIEDQLIAYARARRDFSSSRSDGHNSEDENS